jgi:hypothetical protein
MTFVAFAPIFAVAWATNSNKFPFFWLTAFHLLADGVLDRTDGGDGEMMPA